MAPAAAGGVPGHSMIISHSHNSHTLRPKLVRDPPVYPKEFCGLDGIHAVDYPGMWESKGPELDISMHLAL